MESMSYVIKLLPFRVYATDRHVWPAICVQRVGCIVEFMSCTMHECLLQPAISGQTAYLKSLHRLQAHGICRSAQTACLKILRC